MNIKVELIRDFMKKYGITEFKLSLLCDITRREMRYILNSDRKSTYYGLYQLAKLMQLTIDDLLE